MIRSRTILNRDRKARHPILKLGSEYLLIWNYVEGHPDCTARDIKDSCKVNHQRISELLDEGLLEVTGKLGHSRTYRVVHENVSGNRRDKVGVHVKLFINKYGEYSATASVVDQMYKAHEGEPVKVAEKVYTLVVPKEDEPVRMLAKTGGLILEGDYSILDE